MVYYGIIEYLDNLDLPIVVHQALEASQRAILPLVNGLFGIQSRSRVPYFSGRARTVWPWEPRPVGQLGPAGARLGYIHI